MHPFKVPQHRSGHHWHLLTNWKPSRIGQFQLTKFLGKVFMKNLERRRGILVCLKLCDYNRGCLNKVFFQQDCGLRAWVSDWIASWYSTKVFKHSKTGQSPYKSFVQRNTDSGKSWVALIFNINLVHKCSFVIYVERTWRVLRRPCSQITWIARGVSIQCRNSEKSL